MRDIRIGDDIIDSREIIAHIEDLEDDIRGYEEGIEEIDEQLEVLSDDESDLAEVNQDALETEKQEYEEEIRELREELEPWLTIREAFEGQSDWDYGEALIHERHFPQYAKELAEDIYEIPDHWPFDSINWDAVAQDLQVDYTEVDVEGHTYWMRA